MSDAPTSPAAARDDRDLYCLQCGYNLRGLSGDPRRCPECGHLNPLGDIELPAEQITAQLRWMEGTPTICVAVLTGWLLVGLGPTLALMDRLLHGMPIANEFLCCGSVPTLFAWFFWTLGVIRFREFCAGAPSWGGALLKYHLYSLGLIATVIGVAVGGMVTLPEALRSSYPLLRDYAPIVTILSLLLLVFIGGRWVRRRLRAVIYPLQREMAVRYARDALRRRLERGTKW